MGDLLDAYWVRAVESHWPRIRAFLDADIAYRGRGEGRSVLYVRTPLGDTPAGA